MSQVVISAEPQKGEWLTQMVLILFFQAPFYFMVALSLYSLVTFNFQIILFLLFLVIAQQTAYRSQKFIGYINNRIKPLQYFKKFIRIYDEEIPQNQKNLFCFHPHSIFSYGMLANMNADNSKMSRMTALASRFLLNFPFVGVMIKLWGIESVNKENYHKLMRAQKDIGIAPGGFEEATLTTPGQFRIYIKNRKGFIKYALQYNYAIRPVLIYNEHKAFKTFKPLLKFRLLLNRFKMPGVLFWGGKLQIFFPTNVELVTVVGKSIHRQRNDKQVSEEQINKIHEKYITQVERLHKKYKDEFGEAPIAIY